MHADFRNYVEELLANQPCPIDTWIHLLNCPKCSQQLEALRKVSGLLSRDPHEQPEPDPLFYTRVQARIAYLRFQSPWSVFLDTGLTKRLILTGLVCTGLLASYLLTSSSQEDNPKMLPRRVDLTNLKPSNLPAQRDAVLTNFVVDSRPVEDVAR